MNLIGVFADDSPEGERKLYEICQKYYKLKNEYTTKGLEAPPKEMALKLMLTIEEYSELSQYIEGGGFDDIIRNRIAEDFINGAKILPEDSQP